MSLDSKQVEERVLKMTFDNDSFERKTKQSLTTLEKLKSSLDFRGASKGFENISSNTNILSKNINVLNSGVQSIQHEFSSLEVIGATCLVNLTNAAIKAGKNMVNALTLEPVKTGFQEYETKMGSIQTILTNTAKHGTTLNDVVDALDRLNLYADKTIYNFQQMTRNVGTFTAAGLDLETSTNSIQGIANLAAASGSTAQQASTAMYQLSQALSAGSLKLQDWNSVVNAGMGGTLFQDALKETAKEMGTDVDAIIEAEGSFRNSLQKGWITADVLSTTLRKFTVSGAKEYGEAMMQNGEYTMDANKALMEQAQRMEDAATKVKTFSQLWDTLKETAQSGWGKTWEIIVGDYDKAKEFFTQVNDVISPLLDKMADARNNLLETALGSPSKWNEIVGAFSKAGMGIDTINSALAKTYASKGIIKDISEFDALLERFGGDYTAMMQGIKKEGLDSFGCINLTREALKEAVRENANYTETQMSATDKLKTFQKVVNDVWQGDYGNQSWNKERQKALEAEGYEYERVQRLVNLVQDAKSGYALTMEDLTEEDLRSLGLTKAEIEAYKELEVQLKDTDSELNSWIDSIQKASGRDLLIDSLYNIGRAIKSVVKPIAEAYQAVFAPFTGDDLYNGIESFNKFTQSLILNEEKASNLKNVFITLFNVFDSIRLVVSSGLRLGFGLISRLLKSLNIEVGPLFESLANGTGAIRQWMHDNDIVDYLLNKVGPGIDLLGEKITWLFNKLRELPIFENGITNGLIDLLNEIKTVASEKFNGLFGKLFGDKDPGTAIAESINPKEAAKKVTEQLASVAGNIKTNIGETISNSLDKEGSDSNVGDTVKDKITNKFVFVFKSAFSGIGEALKTAFKWLVEKVNPATLIAGSFIFMLLKITEKITSVLFIFEKPMDALAGFFKSWGKVGTSVAKYVDAKKTSLVVNNFLKVAAALLVMSFAIRNIGTMKGTDIAKGVTAVVVLILALQGLTYVIGRGLKDQSLLKVEGAFGLLLGMAAMVGIVAKALLSFKDLTPDQIGSATLALTAVMGLVTLFLVVIHKLYSVNNDKIDLPGLGAVLWGLSFSVKRMVDAMKTAGELDMGIIKRGLAVVSTMMLMLSILMEASMSGHRRNFTGSGGLGVTALAAALAVAILVKMVKTAAEVTPEEYKNALKVILTMMSMITAVAIISRIGKGGNAGLAIMSWMGAFLLIPLVVKEINVLKLHDVDYAFSVMTSISSMFSWMLIASKMAGKYAVKGAVLITAATLMMAVMVPVIALLTMIGSKDPNGLKRAVHSIAIILGMFSILTFMSSVLNHGDIGSAKSVIIAAGIIVALLAGVAIAIGSLDTKTIIQGIGAVVAVLLAIGFMFWAASKIVYDKNAGYGVDKGALFSIFGFVVIIIGMMAAMAGAMVGVEQLSKNPMFAMFLGSGTSLDSNKLIMMFTTVAMFVVAISIATSLMMKNAPRTALPAGTIKSLLALTSGLAGLCIAVYAALTLIHGKSEGGDVKNDIVKMGAAVATVIAIALLSALITKIASKIEYNDKLGDTVAIIRKTCYAMGLLLLEAAAIIVALGSIGVPSIDFKSLAQILVIMLMMGLMGSAIGVIAAKIGDTDIKPAANNLVGICIAMGFIAAEAGAVLKTINAMELTAVDWAVIGNLIAIMAAMAVIGGLLAIFAKNAPTGEGVLGQYLGTGGMFVVVGAVATGIANWLMPALNNVGSYKILPKAGALCMILGAVAVVAAFMTGVGTVFKDMKPGEITKTILSDGGILVVVGAVAWGIAEKVMPALNDVHGDNILEKALGLCAVLLSIGVIAAVLIGVSKLTDGVDFGSAAKATGIFALVGLVTEFLAAFGAILVGDLAIWFNQPEVLDSVMNVTSKLPEIGENIGSFIDSISAATEGREGSLTIVSDFMDIVTELGKLTVLNEIIEALGISEPIFETFGTMGEKLAGGISSMLSAMNEASLDPDAVKKFADCIKPILELQLMMYGSNGVLQFFLGEKDLSTFGSQLADFATGAGKFIAVIEKGVELDDGTMFKPNWVNDESIIKQVCACMKPMIELQKLLYGTGGLKQAILGEKNLTAFMSDMVTAVDKVGAFMKGMELRKTYWTEEAKERTDIFAYCITKLAKAADAIPNSGGLVGKIFGENDPATFGTQLETLANSMNIVNDSISTHEWKKDMFDNYGACIEAMGAAVEKIPATENGWLQNLLSIPRTDITMFAADIRTLTSAMISINKDLNGSATALFQNGKIVTIFESLESVLDHLPTNDDDRMAYLDKFLTYNDTNDFTGRMTVLGESIAAFAKPLEGVSSQNIASSATSLDLMTKALSNASAIDFGNLDAYGGSLANLGQISVDGFCEAFEGSYAKCAEAVSAFAKALEEAYNVNGVYRMKFVGRHMSEDIHDGLKEKIPYVEDAARMLCKAAYSILESYANETFRIGGNVAQGFINGINSKIRETQNAVDDMTDFIGPRMMKNLDEKSPSRLTFGIGAYVGEGLVNGMMSTLSMVQDASDTLSEESVTAINNALMNTYNALDQDAFNPTITPVLDMSEVQNGFGYINGMLDNSIIGLTSRNLSVSHDMNTSDVVDTLNSLGDILGTPSVNNYNINGITYDDGSNIASAVGQLIYAANIARRS